MAEVVRWRRLTLEARVTLQPGLPKWALEVECFSEEATLETALARLKWLRDVIPCRKGDMFHQEMHQLEQDQQEREQQGQEQQEFLEAGGHSRDSPRMASRLSSTWKQRR